MSGEQHREAETARKSRERVQEVPSPRRSASEHPVVVIPTYNEVENLELIVSRVRAEVPKSSVLVVDDGSPDGTGALAEQMATKDPKVHVLHRTEKAGLGAAYIAGFAWALDRGYTAVVEMDADGSHDPSHLNDLLEALAEADVVIGSRWIPGGSVVNWPKSRELISRAGNLYVRLALRMSVRDATAGFRAYKREVLESFELASVASQGYCFQVDLTWRAVRGGFRVAEVPITFRERERGQSKMSGSIVREALWRVTQWGAADRLGRAKCLTRAAR